MHLHITVPEDTTTEDVTMASGETAAEAPETETPVTEEARKGLSGESEAANEAEQAEDGSWAEDEPATDAENEGVVSEPAQPQPEPAAQPQPTPEPEPRRALAQWVSVNKAWRTREAAFLSGSAFSSAPTIAPDGSLTQMLAIGECYFLLYLDCSFPHPTGRRKLPARVYLVSPSIEECGQLGLVTSIRQHVDESGMCYICDDSFYREYVSYCNGVSKRPLTQSMVRLAKRWERGVTAQKARITHQQRNAEQWGAQRYDAYQGYGSAQGDSSFAQAASRRQISLGSAIFQDGRASRGLVPPRDCQRIVMSSRAFAQIYTETQARIGTETGGLLLGHYDNGTWYVIEACDPGWNGVFQVAYHEADENYENHVIAVTSRLYRHPLVFLGMWHRHPGSLDRFSGTDDVTNWQYVDTCPANGCISGLVNYDPDFRMTFYFAQQDGRRMRYTTVDVEVGDELFDRPELLQMATMADVNARDWR